MGVLASKLFSGPAPSRILLLGLDGAGKTTILYRLKTKKTEITVPTIGFNVETVTPCKGTQFTVWDVGGQDKFRPLWRHYFEDTSGLFFIIDSNDRERVIEARQELLGIFESEKMEGVPVVIIANKQDLPNAMNPKQIEEALGLPSLLGRQWIIQGCCAIKGDGLLEGMKEMSRLIKERRKSISVK